MSSLFRKCPWGESFTQDLPAFLTLPTQLQKQGDFSQTFDTQGNLIKIYDPATTRPDPNNPGILIRDQFPGNVIPSNRIDPVALKILGFFPNPNQTGIISGANNYLGTRRASRPTPSYNFRVDQQWNDKNRTFFAYNRHVVNGSFPSIFGIPGFGDPGVAAIEDFPMYEITATHTYVPNRRWVLATSFLWMDFHQIYNDLGFNQDLPAKTWGLTGLSPVIGYPTVSMAGYTAAGGGGEFGQLPIKNYSFAEDVTAVLGKHSVKFGYTAIRVYQRSHVGPSASLNFGVQPTALPNVTNTGNGVAALLLGFPVSTSESAGFYITQTNLAHEAYVQDDWKALSNLTLNVGLRWHGLSYWTATDSQGKPLTSGFNPNCVNPVSGTPGCVTYAGTDFPSSPVPWTNKYFAPRLGLSWLPWGAGSKTVLRAGAGIYWMPLQDAGAGGGAGITFCCFNQTKSGSFSSPDNGITAPFLLKTGVPPIPPFSAEDHGFGAVPGGQNPRLDVGYVDRNLFRRSYSEEYNLTVQRQVWASTEISASYLLYLGRHVEGTVAKNQLTPSQFGPGNAQLRRPFPQYGNITNQMDPGFTSSYNALFLEAKKRYSNGLNFDAQYLFGKSLVNTGLWNAYDFKSGNHMVEPQHRFVGYAVYDLPWGPGRRWVRSGASSRILGGWNFAPVLRITSGSYLDATYISNTTNGFLQGNQGVNVIGGPNNGPRTMAQWFNTAAFVPPAPYTLGNAGRTIVEGPRSVFFDAGISRIDRVTERISTQFGADLFNAFNHSNLNNPNTTLGSPTFGIISSKSGNRSIQLRLRVFF